MTTTKAEMYGLPTKPATWKQRAYVADLFGQVWLQGAKTDKSQHRWAVKKMFNGILASIYQPADGDKELKNPMTVADVQRYVDQFKAGTLVIPSRYIAKLNVKSPDDLNVQKSKAKSTAKTKKSTVTKKVEEANDNTADLMDIIKKQQNDMAALLDMVGTLKDTVYDLQNPEPKSLASVMPKPKKK